MLYKVWLLMTAPIDVCLLGSIQLSKSISPLFTFHLDCTLDGFFKTIFDKNMLLLTRNLIIVCNNYAAIFAYLELSAIPKTTKAVYLLIVSCLF